MFPEYITIKSRRYKVREGTRGGHFVTIQGKKHYLKKTQQGGFPSSSESVKHVIQVFENVEDDERKRNAAKRNQMPHAPYYHERRSMEDPQVRRFMAMFFPADDNMHPKVHQVLDELYRLQKYNEENIIDKKVVPSNAHIIVVGDVHGEKDPLKNTMVHWYDQGFINERGHLRNDVYVVSTGDIVDYNVNSFDVLYALLTLRNINPDHVVLLRGNHEGEWWVSGKHTLYDELSMKEILPILHEAFVVRGHPDLPDEANDMMLRSMQHLYFPAFEPLYPRLSKEEVEALVIDWVMRRPFLDDFLYFSALLRNVGRTVLLLQFEDDSHRFAFMHGMWPVVNYGKRGHLDLSIWKEDDEYEEFITPMRHDDRCVPNYHMAAMWNDLSDGTLTRRSNRGIPFCVELGSSELFRIMHESHVKAMIRGHQDLCHTQQGMMPKTPEGNYWCMNGVATKIGVQHKYCASGENPSMGWCVSLPIEVSGPPVDHEDAARRVLTSSMAHWKSGGFACIGAYSVISQNGVTHGGRRRNTRKTKGGNDTSNTIKPVVPPIQKEETPAPLTNCRLPNKRYHLHKAQKEL